MRPINVQPTLLALSTPRLSNYTPYFGVSDDFDLYACYQWNNELSRSFLPILHLIEVSLRNAYHKILSLHFSSLMSSSYPWYGCINLSAKSKKEVDKALRKTNRPDDVISRQTFGFWLNLPDTKGVPWEIIHKEVFPYSSRNWKKLPNQDWLYARIKMINDLRNRIAHWEPIWKIGPLFEEARDRSGRHLLQQLAPATVSPAESIFRLNMYYDRMRSLLSLINPDLVNTYEDSYTHEHLSWICSMQGLKTYRASTRNRTITVSQFKRCLNSAIKSKNLITISLKGEPCARLMPL
ncbi:Abi family protein [Pseudomonas luteola]|uniref:Abi family protein n=1 Tax=Pseudomonas luteola TaxID=47886 RepID=UPI00163A7B92|nr:Abi family protein [Pseudomonas luteola]